MTDLSDFQVGDRLFSDLSPADQQCLYLAANVLVQWLLQRTEMTTEPDQPEKC